MKKLLLAVALVLGIVSCGGGGTAGKKEQKLVFYAGLQEDHAALVAQEFEKETGIKNRVCKIE
jgi:iron(III) transport system substrate-binding protein